MRTIIVSLVGVILLASCSKYQFVTVNSDIEKSEKGEIIVENDTFAVKYIFSGLHGPVRIQIVNRLQVPLYVKWNSSSRTKVLWPTAPSRPTLTASSKANAFIVFEGEGEYTQSEQHDETFVIGNNSFEKSHSIPLRKAFFHVSTPDMKNGEMNGDRIRSQYFSRQNTPLMFLSELSYSTSDDFTGGHAVKHEFWVDEVFVTMIKPDEVHRYRSREDMFYLKKGSGVGVFLGLIGFFVYVAASQASN